MPVKVRSSKTISNKGGVKIAVHSEAGQGKTMLAASCPKPVVILCERTGADSLTEENILDVWGDKKGITTDIPIIEAYTSKDIEAAIDFVRESDDYETVIFDSVSEMSKIRLKEILPNHKDGRQAYGEMALAVDTLIREMRDDDKNWLFLFHSGREDVYDEEGEPSATQFVPAFEGQKMQNEFPFLIGDIYCLLTEFDDKGEPIRMLRTRTGDTAYYAKNRRGRLEELEVPHMGSIFWKLTRKAKRK